MNIMNDIKVMEIKAELAKGEIASLMNMLDDVFFKDDDADTSEMIANMLLDKIREFKTIETSISNYYKDSKVKWG